MINRNGIIFGGAKRQVNASHTLVASSLSLSNAAVRGGINKDRSVFVDDTAQWHRDAAIRLSRASRHP